MIDDSDVDFAILASMGTRGWVSVVFAVAAFVLMVARCSSEDECGKRHCDKGKPTVVAHECVCVEKAR